MRHRGFQTRWVTLLLAVLLAAGLVGLTGPLRALHRRAGNPRNGISGRSAADSDRRWSDLPRKPERREAIERPGATGVGLSPSVPTSYGDPRFESLRQAAMTWRHSTGPRRLVVDQVCLVPDVPSFFEAIATWDERHFFPILIDEPAWTLPFLRAFRPARVVRYTARGDGAGAASRQRPTRELRPRRRTDSPSGRRRWRPWRGPGRTTSPPNGKFPPAGSPPQGLGPTPPGVVLTAPDSPMLAGAVALAAGRFQPLVRLEPSMWSLDETRDAGRVFRFGDVLTLPQALRFARRLEGRVASVTPRYDQLGDDCDFLTIAGDWPYRYENDVERGLVRGIHALDDLIGRNLEGEPDAARAQRDPAAVGLCWPVAGRPGRERRPGHGRLVPPAGHDAALGHLQRGEPLVRVQPGAGGRSAQHGLQRAPRGIFFRAGPRADLASWHRVVDPMNRFGFVWINSSGNPSMFNDHRRSGPAGRRARRTPRGGGDDPQLLGR